MKMFCSQDRTPVGGSDGSVLPVEIIKGAFWRSRMSLGRRARRPNPLGPQSLIHRCRVLGGSQKEAQDIPSSS